MSNWHDILLVEDNIHDAELTIWALNQSRITNSLLHLQDGEEAIDYLFATGKFDGRVIAELPKLILLDLKMPKLSGLDVLEKIKSDERTRIIPVVLLTSSKEEKDIIKSYQLGVNSFIVKPVDFDNFVKAISDIGFYWLLMNQNPKL